MAGALNHTAAPTFGQLFNGSVHLTTGCFLENHRQILQKAHCRHRRRQSPVQEFSVSVPPNFRAPQPKPFSVRPDKVVDILGASLALLFHFTTTVLVSGYSVALLPSKEIPSDQYALGFAGFKLKETSKVGPRPEMPIKKRLHIDFDGTCENACSYPFCRKVDPNTGVSMYESDDIIKYLVGKYGDGKVPFLLSLGLFTTLTEGYAMIGCIRKGSSYTPSKLLPKPLEIWAYEASPFCKVVRKVLVELELPYILHSCAHGSPKKQILYQRVRHFQVFVSIVIHYQGYEGSRKLSLDFHN